MNMQERLRKQTLNDVIDFRQKAGKKQKQKVTYYPSANGNSILTFLRVCLQRRNCNFNLEFDRDCVGSFHDGAFQKVPPS